MASIFFSKNVFFQLFVSLLILETHHYVTSSRITRAVMMSVAPNVNYNCSDLTITGKNMTSHIIVTGTVSTCSVPQAGSYRCTLQIWRVMKGKKLISNRSIESQQGPYNQKLYVNVYGLGNNIYCESNVKDHDTRIFFLNRSNNRLVLSASLLRITLSNLQNTQAVIEGQKIVEIPKKPYDPCLSILCGYGAHCEVSGGLAYCVCPDFLCDSSEERLELNAPFCGSDGVTYPNECKLQDVQCMTQKRIKAVSSSPCEPDCDGEDRGSEICKVSSTTTAPVPSVNLCNSTYCGFSADCVVKAGPNGRMAPSCECPTCEGAGVKPVCASDQKSYTSVCELRRKACNEASNISIVRHSACSPCQVYDDTMKDFVLACSDGCLLTQSGEMLCCSDVKCQSSRPGSVCGSDGNNYESECALKRYACSTARNISVIRYDLCPNKRSTTIARGTITLENDLNCPGECDPGNNRFQKFIRKLESSVNKLISVLSADDIDGRKMEEFSVVGTRNDGTILFKAGVSTSMNPIGLEQHPGDGYEWVAGWLLDQAIVVVLRNEEVTFKLPSAPHDKLFIEDVCLDVQCEHGAVCALRREEEVLLPSCSCQDIGDADRGPVTMACMLASDGISHDLRFMNENDMRKNMCSSRSFYTFRDGCIDSPMNSCADIGGCTAPGQVCMQVDGRSVCGCITCNDEDEPVCGSDGQTYRSECELVRENCTSGGGLSLRRSGHCESQCDDVKCWYGAQCEVEAEGTICVCPTNCLASISPVCGSDCVSYSNECEMVVEMCEKKLNLHVIHRGTCDDSAECAEVGSGLSDTGSGEDDDCQCRFGATCDGTRDDEDSECVCSFTCPQSPVDEMCAADDVTYINACEHKRAECEKQTSIPIIGIGSCADVCRTSRYGCCQDGETSAKGPAKAGCPEMCKCNVHGSYGSSCELSGQCVCKPGVGGLKCDRCKPGFWNFRGLAQGLGTGCMACRCHSDGSTRDDCEQMTGRCQCKEGVRGSKCSQCESDGSWVTSAVCRENTGLPSCAGQVCGTGQECINIDGSFTCQCPNFSDCDGFQGPEICGSDGLSYPDACQMRVMACKQGVEVHAVAEGLCKAYPIEETLPSGEEGYPTPSSDTPDASVGSSTTPTVPPSTTTLVTSTTTSYIDNEIEASISPDCEFDDDEDCLGSGMEHLMESSTAVQQSESSTTLSASSRLQESTTLQSTSTTFRSSAQHDQFFTATGIFKEVDGQTLNYDADLSDPTSSPFEEYNNLITSKVTEYLGNPLLNGQITSVRIASFADNQHWFWGSNGVKVDMVIHHDSAASPEQLLELLNKVSDIPHEFSVSEQAESYTSTGLTVNESRRYEEDLEWLVPQFGGSSFAEFSPVDDAFSLLTLKMKFRSFDGEGLLFFISQTLQDGDFVSLSVGEGQVEFRFDTGSGPLILKSSFQVSDGKWHNLVARRNRREGMLTVDDQPSIYGTSPAGSIGLDVRSNIFVGGFPSELEDRIGEHVGIGKGLTGCIKEAQVQDRDLPMSSIDDINRISVYRLAPCQPSPCFPNLCGNSSNCFISKETNSYMNKCECAKGFGGSLCGEKVESCAELNCDPPSACGVDPTTKKHICTCAPGMMDPLCKNKTNAAASLPTFMPGFAQDSYLIRPSMGSVVKSSMQVTFVFYSSQPEGLIFYNAQKKSGNGDYVAVYLLGHHLVFQYDLGSGPALIRSSRTILLNEWHEVVISQRMGMGEMSVDGRSPDRGESPRGHTKLNLKQPLYLAGTPRNVNPPPALSTGIGLTGALQKFQVNGLNFDLSPGDSMSHYNVRPFNAHPCYHTPCLNGGSCHPHLGSYTCVCTDAWRGEHCEDN